MRERLLRRHCRGLLRELGIRPPLDVTELCARLAHHRGKPISLTAHRFQMPGPFGAWLATSRADYIFYQEATSRPHQVHIILHEVGHMIAGHHGGEQGGDLTRVAGPGAVPEVTGPALRRTAYGTVQEHEAETVATIVLQWASVLDSVVPRLPADPAGQRMHNALGDRMGWL